MPVVPHIRPGQRQRQPEPAPPPPDPVYAMMAATQMHSEGRLLAPTGDVSDKMNSIPPADQAAIR